MKEYDRHIKTRNRKQFSHRWSDDETLTLLTEVAKRVEENPTCFEKPSAPIFYASIDAECPLLRPIKCMAKKCKMRYLRSLFVNASQWLEKTGNELYANGEEDRVTEYINKTCPYFRILGEIFSHPKQDQNLGSFSEDTDMLDDNKSKLWTKDDERKIIEFLRQHKDLYEILPRQFYEKLLQKTNINADLLELRNKIRNMRQQYEKACLFLKEPDQSIMKIGETPEDVALRFCYFYEQFKDIFKKETCPAPAIKPRNESEKNDLSANRLNELGAACKIRVKNMFSPMMEEDPLEGMSLNGLDNNDGDAGDSPIVDNEFYFKDEDNSVKQKDELYLKVRQKEIESNERLKRMEMSMKERIAIREIEMKEKVALKELEICQNYLRSAGEPQKHDIDQIVESFEQFSE